MFFCLGGGGLRFFYHRGFCLGEFCLLYNLVKDGMVFFVLGGFVRWVLSSGFLSWGVLSGTHCTYPQVGGWGVKLRDYTLYKNYYFAYTKSVQGEGVESGPMLGVGTLWITHLSIRNLQITTLLM